MIFIIGYWAAGEGGSIIYTNSFSERSLVNSTMTEPIPEFMDYMFKRGARTKPTYTKAEKKRLEEMQQLKDFIDLNKKISENIAGVK